MAIPRIVRVAGPLAPYSDGFRADLGGRGYSPWSVRFDLETMADLSRWLVAAGLDLAGLTAAEVERFVRQWRAAGGGRYRRGRPRGLRLLVDYLRGPGVIPETEGAVADDRLERLLAEFTTFLINERGVAPETVVYYRAAAVRFLSRHARGADGELDLELVTAEAIRAFVIGETRRHSAGSVKKLVTALRGLLRFLRVRGHLDAALEDGVPSVAGRRPLPPTTPDADDIAALLSGCDRDTVVGRRDYAILVLLIRLGLRVSEVASLAVDDVDWAAGEIVVRGKGNRHERMPVPVDVGAAIADYCRRGRPCGASRRVFLHVQAPYGGLSGSAVADVVATACRRAGVPRIGAHRLRHAAAGSLRRAGAPLFEIGQLLRHASPLTTADYGTIDTHELWPVTMPWPGGAR